MAAAASVQSEFYEHRGPGPKWVPAAGDARETPSIREARLVLADWLCDRANLGFQNVDSYKEFVKEDIARLKAELLADPEFLRQLVVAQAAGVAVIVREI